MKTKNVAVIFGGVSSEHEVSIRSAIYIIDAIAKMPEYQAVPVYIDKTGQWNIPMDYHSIQSSADDFISMDPNYLVGPYSFISGTKTIKDASSGEEIELDIAFPITHGTNGEDGSLQGLLQLCEIPYVGPKVAGSSIAMDKDIAKRLLIKAGVNVAKSITVREVDDISYDNVKTDLGEVVFVKPCRQGSSVGVNKATDAISFKKALESAFEHDSKVMIEEAIVGRELEVAVMEKNGKLITSGAGEIYPPEEGYTFEEKYEDTSQTDTAIPAEISDDNLKEIQGAAVKACRALECFSMSRVDFFLSEEKGLILNEINTLPGFTSISMYPRLFEAAGMSAKELVKNLIEGASWR